MAKETYDTLKAWGFEKNNPTKRSGNKQKAEYWESMAKSLRRVLGEKEIYIEQLEEKLSSVQDYINYMEKTNQ